jgi:hypothetical protein
MPTETMIIAIFLLLIATIVAVFLTVFFLWRRVNFFFKGKQAASLEDHLNTLTKEVAFLRTEKENLSRDVKTLQEKARQALCGVGAVRFNAFTDAGGNQSFAVALLDEKGDGVILSSLYAREKTSVFAKPIAGLASEYELSVEEKEALKKAKR